MGEEQAFFAVKRFDLCHIFRCQCKIKNIKVLLHPVFVDGLWNDNHIALHQEAESGLCGSFSMDSRMDAFAFS